MLPLVQMHHQMVQPSSHLDSLASFQPQLAPDYFSPLDHPPSNVPRLSNPFQQHAAHPSQRGIPIRSSQPTPTLHRITTSFSHNRTPDHADSQLRRKTPSGTIDNGYDGSVAHLASGPPPLKHMIMPMSTKIYPTANMHLTPDTPAVNHQQQFPGRGWPYSATTPSHGLERPLIETLRSAPPTFAGWSHPPSTPGQELSVADRQTLMQPLAQQLYPAAGSRMQPGFLPGYQPASGPAVFTPTGFQPSSLWRDGGIYPDYRATVPLAAGYAPQNAAAVDSAFIPSTSMIHHGLLNGPSVEGQQFGLPLPSHPLDDGYLRQSSHHAAPYGSQRRIDLSSFGGPVHVMKGSLGDGARFKERALGHAHKTYADLLAFLSHSKKAQNGRLAPGSRSSSKMVVFPCPPKQLSTGITPSKPRITHSYTEPTTATYAQHMALKQAAAARALNFGPRNMDRHPVAAGAMDATPNLSAAVVTAEILSHPNANRFPYPSKLHRHHPQELGSPLINAKAALEMLHNLCEQSGWKWIDGMLLGGCLHYGLEHYEDALEWFRRIISLDEFHVEAISNIAATLYCLNRQEEAEQHWVQAVKLRPSYLEAVEHLVGLLCSNHRSQEAVHTISFVQKALKIPDRNTLRDPTSDGVSEAGTSSVSSARAPSEDGFLLDAETDSPKMASTSVEAVKNPGFGSSGYAIPGNENGRMLLLIHAKGNMLYALKNIDQASEAFEEAVLISSGRQFRGIQSLIHRIQKVLAAPGSQMANNGGSEPKPLSAPLLLPPERAKRTAHLVFAETAGHLPGLRHVLESNHKKSAVATTSNALLSLAKIFQDAMSNGGAFPGLVKQPTGVGDILALYYLSLSLQESPSTANNVGILLASVQQTASQVVSAAEIPGIDNIPGITPGSGLGLALAYYHYGLQIDSKHVHLHTNLGSLLKDIGQLDMAIQMYERAVACDGTFDIALTNLANAVKDRGRISDAIVYYRRAVQANPDFAEAVCGLSTALNSVCDWRGRGGVVLADGRFDRWHVDDEGMLFDVRNENKGSRLVQKVVDIVGRQLRDAANWGHGVLREPVRLHLLSQLKSLSSGLADGSFDLDAALRKWAGQPWEGSRIVRLVERATRVAMRSWYLDKYVRRTKSASAYRRPRLPSNLSVPSAPTVLPFHTFTCPLTAKDIRMISQRNALRISCSTLRSPWLPSLVYEPPKPPSPHLNIGYVSSDFNNHPLAHLMQSVFGFHDQSRAKAFCYATTGSDKSIHRQQIERQAPVFRDVSNWSPDRLVDQIIEDGIHILVNLNGYTRGARNEIFAARPAPIQMSFMGFAGTLGAEWCDYLLADATAIPRSTLRPHRGNLSLEDVVVDEADNEAEDWIYSENIIFCKDSFFCCDHKQSADGSDEREMTWEEEQRRRWKMRKELFPDLSDDTIILGNFNQLYKIDPTVFRGWLRILANVPNAVLWLLRFPELGESYLKKTARKWAGESVASRIIFTDVAPKQQHISRARVCDLFLDTPECNAHTTAADVLWSSTPLLTLPRYEYKMCSRMAASILKGALPKGPEGDRAASDLVAADDDEYEEFAVKLASGLSYRITPGGYGEGSGRLAELRKLLWQSKWSCALFDTRRWVRDLEDAYEEAWRRWVAGETGDIYL